MKIENFIGIDISKNTLDLALITYDSELVEVKCLNERTNIRETLETLLIDYGISKQNTLICAEHTGHFGNKLIDVCVTFHFNLWLESAYNIIHSQGLKRGKSDRVDAVRISEYAKRYSDKALLFSANKKSIEVMKRLTCERELIVKDIAKYKNQLKQEECFFDQTYFKSKKKRIEKLIGYNEKVLKEIETEIGKIIESDEGIQRNMEKIVSVEGVGRQTAIATIIATGNFTKFENARQFACHCGCAPFKYESGTSRRSRSKVSHRANKELKRIYHMAALSTLRTKGELRAYFDRKVEEGKNKMTVINAIRAKIIARIFAVVKQDRKYEKIYTHSLV